MLLLMDVDGWDFEINCIDYREPGSIYTLLELSLSGGGHIAVYSEYRSISTYIKHSSSCPTRSRFFDNKHDEGAWTVVAATYDPDNSKITTWLNGIKEEKSTTDHFMCGTQRLANKITIGKRFGTIIYSLCINYELYYGSLYIQFNTCFNWT